MVNHPRFLLSVFICVHLWLQTPSSYPNRQRDSAENADSGGSTPPGDTCLHRLSITWGRSSTGRASGLHPGDRGSIPRGSICLPVLPSTMGGVRCQSSTHTMMSRAFESMSKRRNGYPSESQVKRGVRLVGGYKELVEKLGRGFFVHASSTAVPTRNDYCGRV